MKISMCMVLFSALMILENEAATFFEKSAKDYNNPKRCFSTVFNQSLIIGKVYQTPECGRMMCSKKYLISYATCGVIGTSSGCTKQDGDLSLDYPLCCPFLNCDNAIENDEEEFSMVI